MDFDLQWLLIGLPVAFALGWIGSRIDLQQWRRAERDAPRAYFKGLNLLLNEQADKAIDVFIEAVQRDPDTTELHFALGNLFRRRGEFERAVRVHQHLLQRADLGESDRERAQYALAQDYMKAGLHDRAEAAWHALEGTPFETEARLALLGLFERAREWRRAAEMAQRLEDSGTGSFASRIAHHWCEIAQEAEERQQDADAEAALRRAREAAPLAPRPLIASALRAARRGEAALACERFTELRQRNPESFAMVAEAFVDAALAAGQAAAARALLEGLYARAPAVDLLRALARLDAAAGTSPTARWAAHLRAHPASLSAALGLLDEPLAEELRPPLREAIARAARPLQRYRCAGCGFESQRHFWQCPGCLGWDSFPPQRIEEL